MLRRLLYLSVLIAAHPALAGETVSPSPAEPDKPVKPAKPAKPVKPAGSSILGGSPDALAGSLRGYLIRHLPTTLYEASPGWGEKDKTPIRRKMKNDGTWRRIKVTAPNLPDTLIFDLRNVNCPYVGPMTFDVFVSFDAHVDYVKQDWWNGIKMYDGSVSARFRIKLSLSCVAVVKTLKPDAILPDTVFRLRVVRSDLKYDNFVLEHVSGVGGEAAKILGDAAKASLREWFPHVERDLLAKANAAIVKAGDTKEVHLGLGSLMGGKSSSAQPSKTLIPLPGATRK